MLVARPVSPVLTDVRALNTPLSGSAHALTLDVTEPELMVRSPPVLNEVSPRGCTGN